MTEHELAHPHDLLTRYFLADPELMASLLENYIANTNQWRKKANA